MITELLAFVGSGTCIDSSGRCLDVLAVFQRRQIDHAADELVTLLVTNARPLY